MRTEDLPIYRAFYEIVVLSVNFTKNYPRDYKFSLGEKINNTSFNCVEKIFRANACRSSKDRASEIEDCLESLKILELFMRLSKDLQLLSVKQFSSLIELTEQAGKQLWG